MTDACTTAAERTGVGGLQTPAEVQTRLDRGQKRDTRALELQAMFGDDYNGAAPPPDASGATTEATFKVSSADADEVRAQQRARTHRHEHTRNGD